MIEIKNISLTTYESDIRALINSFYPGEEIYYSDDLKNTAETTASRRVFLDIDELCSGIKRSDDRFEDKTFVKKAVYEKLAQTTGRELPWGTLTGIRPVRIAEMFEEQGITGEKLKDILKHQFLISDEKSDLMMKIYENEKSILSSVDYKNGYSVYIGIPFCPTRCVYCSFTAYPFAIWENRADEYIDMLAKELRQLNSLSAAHSDNILKDKKLQTIYIGGGTPSVLSAKMIDRLFCVIGENLDLSSMCELTFEAGRPDTITKEKLEVLKKHDVTRISINPQTMCQKTLDLIGRKHTVEETIETFGLARELGFDNINMDLIAGLPGEDVDDFKHTVSEIKKLAPDSLTVHTLAVKRASRLSTEGNAWGGMTRAGLDTDGCDRMQRMTELGAEYAGTHGLEPYYIYRQKNMAGSLENIGYAAAGKENLYNILMMEEKHTVVGIGAGSSTKAVIYGKTDRAVLGRKVLRCENVKNIADYLSRNDELLKKKHEFFTSNGADRS